MDYPRARPNDFVIIGLDTKHGNEHPLFDERARVRLAEAMVTTVADKGVCAPVIVQQMLPSEVGVDVLKHAGGLVKVVIDGRQRIRAAREVERRFRKNVLVPFIVDKRTMSDAAEVAIVTNECRVSDRPSVRAKKVSDFVNGGAGLIGSAGGARRRERAAELFGCTVQTVRNYEDMAAAHPQLQYAVDEGAITFKAALKLFKTPWAEQEKAAARALGASEKDEDGEGNGGASGAQRSGKPPSKKQVLAFLADTKVPRLYREGVAWARGLTLGTEEGES